ncbi:MAG: hypothetical protein JEZ12_24005 [Desulfobacterium sp.]|nr:hypothetical protein [Desulfobacterium sp.]
MAEEISWEIRATAMELYVTDGKTYDQVAGLTGVSVSQLKRWGQAEEWAAARREYREALTSIRRDTVKLRAGLLKKALDSKDSQDVYAFAAMEKIEASRKTGIVQETQASPTTEILRPINTPQDAVDALQEVIELKMNKLLEQPGVLQLKQVTDLKKTMELVDQMRSKYKPETEDDQAKDGGLTDETADEIRRQILGVKS